jgi:hypothetical protein
MYMIYSMGGKSMLLIKWFWKSCVQTVNLFWKCVNKSPVSKHHPVSQQIVVLNMESFNLKSSLTQRGSFFKVRCKKICGLLFQWTSWYYKNLTVWQDFQNHFMSSIDFPPILYIIYMFSNKANNYQIRRPWKNRSIDHEIQQCRIMLQLRQTGPGWLNELGSLIT